jgi:hypothetical protein
MSNATAFLKVDGTWRQQGASFVRINNQWRTIATMFVKINGTWRSGGLGGEPGKPILQYVGPGSFQILGYDPNLDYQATLITGSGSANLNTSTGVYALTEPNARFSVSAAYAPGAPRSALSFMERKAAVLVVVEFTQFFNPCGDCRTDVDPNSWTCGCVGADAGGGQWGVCICRGPGFSFYEDFSGQGYIWSGADYTNGQGEWYKIS